MKESPFQSKLIKGLKGEGALCFNVHGHAMQAPGWPDLQVYSPIWTGHLELKTTSAVTELQWSILEKLVERGTNAFVLQGGMKVWGVINVRREVIWSGSPQWNRTLPLLASLSLA
jgi:hypothetical protein